MRVPVFIIGVPTGSRTPVTGVKGRCPRPLDDGDVSEPGFIRPTSDTLGIS